METSLNNVNLNKCIQQIDKEPHIPGMGSGTIATGLSIQTVLNKINKIIKQIITLKNHFYPGQFVPGCLVNFTGLHI